MQPKPVSAVKKALSLIEIVNESEHALRITDLAIQMDMHRGSISRIANELVELGWLFKYQDKYFPGPAVLKLSKNAMSHSLAAIIAPTLESIVQETQMMANLQILELNGSRVIDARRPDRYRMVSLMLGDLMVLHRSAGLMALVAQLNDAEQQHYISLAEQAGCPPEQLSTLAEELRESRDQGHSFLRRRSEDIVASMGKVVFAPDGSTFCALTVIGLDAEFDDQAQQSVEAVLTAAAKQIEQELAHFKP